VGSVSEGRTIVVAFGKTNAKASLWGATGALISRRVRTNDRWPPSAAGYRTLDLRGIDEWLVGIIREFAESGPVARIVTVGHGAAAALIRDGRLHAAPMDYEIEIPADDLACYRVQRDPFERTGSPALPQGLNLGVQLHRLENLRGPLPDDVLIVPWPQYWSWRFCGIASSEVTSLGSHSDLWRPTERGFSDLAVRRGWAARMAPLRHGADVLGPITADFAAATGLNDDCAVLCGLHDSNAALLAARGHAEIADNEATVLSTGTWFVAMRSAAADVDLDIGALEESRDCLVNVDVDGRPTLSARFMGGREAEVAGGVDSFALTVACDPRDLLARLPELVASGAGALPGFAPGVGPFPGATGSWVKRPDDSIGLRAATALYLALVANTSLDLIGSRHRLLVEGRFAEDPVFVGVLATLRAGQRVYISNAEHDVAYGALRLTDPNLPPMSALTPVEPLDLDLRGYAATWRERAERVQAER
jgi:sugar (pentulose or hexulose) kinase